MVAFFILVKKYNINKMNKDFTPYEQALELAKLNFNEKCFGYYGLENELYIEISCNLDSNLTRRNFIATPTFSQAFRWFREKYGYDVSIKKCTPSEYKFEIEQLFVKDNNYYFIDFAFSSYEEAELECLKKLIEIVKNK